MGASRKSQSTRAKRIRPGKRRPSNKARRRIINPSAAELPNIPEGIRVEIEEQRGVLIAVMTLLHCLHVVLEHQKDHGGEALSAGAKAAIRWANLPDMTEMLLERVHTVHLALDSVCLAKALQSFRA
jgi:hypothetical protein